MNLCKDCKHVQRYKDGTVHGTPYCLRDGRIEPVLGNPTGPFCQLERQDDRKCGPEGRFFEAWTE